MEGKKNDPMSLYSSQTYLSSFVSSDTFEVQFYDQPAVQGTRIALEMQLRFLRNGDLGKGERFVIRVSVPFILLYSQNCNTMQTKKTACKLKACFR